MKASSIAQEPKDIVYLLIGQVTEATDRSIALNSFLRTVLKYSFSHQTSMPDGFSAGVVMNFDQIDKELNLIVDLMSEIGEKLELSATCPQR